VEGANAQNSRKNKELQSVIDELEEELENERAARQKVYSGNLRFKTDTKVQK